MIMTMTTRNEITMPVRSKISSDNVRQSSNYKKEKMKKEGMLVYNCHHCNPKTTNRTISMSQMVLESKGEARSGM